MLQFIEFLGIVTFALSGIVEARRKKWIWWGSTLSP